jgi:hypothetical protein
MNHHSGWQAGFWPEAAFGGCVHLSRRFILAAKQTASGQAQRGYFQESVAKSGNMQNAIPAR